MRIADLRNFEIRTPKSEIGESDGFDGGLSSFEGKDVSDSQTRWDARAGSEAPFDRSGDRGLLSKDGLHQIGRSEGA